MSGQLNAENFAMAFGDVYTFGPTFRAENSNTARHAAEFWMVEPEIAFADLEDDMELAESMLKYVIRDVMERCPDELAMLNKFVDKGLLERLDHVASSDFARVTYTEAIDILLAAQAAGAPSSIPLNGASTCRPSTSGSSPSRFSRNPFSSPTTPGRSKPSTCA